VHPTSSSSLTIPAAHGNLAPALHSQPWHSNSNRNVHSNRDITQPLAPITQVSIQLNTGPTLMVLCVPVPTRTIDH
jgi:hypothetical protein